MGEYSSQTVAQLKELLKTKGLSATGNKSELVSRLEEAEISTVVENAEAPVEVPVEAPPAEVSAPEAVVEEPVAVEQPEPIVAETEEPTLTVIQPAEPKQLTAEDRKAAAIELISKKISRAKKFGDDQNVLQFEKELKRVEKFGVELGTALAKEIGLMDGELTTNKGFNKNSRGIKKGKFNKKQRK